MLSIAAPSCDSSRPHAQSHAYILRETPLELARLQEHLLVIARPPPPLSARKRTFWHYRPRAGQQKQKQKQKITLGQVTLVQVEPSSKRSLPLQRSSLFRTLKDILSTMPSFMRNPHRAYSFPPWLEDEEAEHDSCNNLPDIDEDPFAHFISPITEAEDPYELSLSAGIDLDEGPHTTKATKFKSKISDKWAHYIKQNHNELHTQYHAPTIYEDDEETFMGLDDARLNDTPHVVSQLSPTKITFNEPSRGRAQDLAARKQQNRRRYSRTLSGHRHSWREPSPDLFTVDESEEEETPVLRRAKTRKAKDGAERRRSSTRSKSRVRVETTERSRL